MGVRHRGQPHVGGQFHPESVLTDAGKQVIENSCSAVVRSQWDQRVGVHSTPDFTLTSLLFSHAIRCFSSAS